MSNIRSVAAQLPLATEDPRWYAFRTMFKREKMVERRLRGAGLEVYVPLRTIVKHYKSKTVTSRVPLFSSYVFVRLTAKQYPVVLADGDVFKIVRFQGEVGRVGEEEIQFLKNVLRDGDEDFQAEEVTGFTVGAEVVIAGGTLAGTKGRILESNGSHNFLVELRTLGLALKVSVRDEHLAMASTLRMAA